MPDASTAAGAGTVLHPRPLPAILSTVAFSFIGFLNIGMALAVVPGFVHGRLGFSAVLAGLAISTQYLATFLSRPHVGRMADARGPKRTVQTGLLLCSANGVLMVLAALAAATPALSLALLLLARLALGGAESCISTGAIAWGMGQVGHQHTARVISWNGVATYGALAAGAPLGVWLAQGMGFIGLGLATLLLMAVAWPLARRKPATAISHEPRQPFRHVARRVLPYGAGLALGSIGFGCIATFITLYFDARGWHEAALALSLFGLCFVGTRFAFGWSIARYGGLRAASVSFAVEMLGLALLWLAPGQAAAMAGAALAGLGFSLVFPALGTEAVHRVPAPSRGTALGLYSVALDVSLAVIGPLGGWAASGMGFASVYLLAALAALAGALLTLRLARRPAAG